MVITPRPSTPTPSKPRVLQLAIKEKPALYASYIPFFPEGGIFVPTPYDYRLGEGVYLLLTIVDDPQRYPVEGKVAWINPANAANHKPQGIGVRFPADDKARQLKVKIEEVLGAAEASNKPTNTI
jgi:type IV pilus assembly protein PilZ